MSIAAYFLYIQLVTAEGCPTAFQTPCWSMEEVWAAEAWAMLGEEVVWVRYY